MVFGVSIKHWYVYLLVSVIILFGIGIFPCEAQQAANRQSEMGEIKLEGKNIQRLVLQSKGDSQETFKQPGESINLPPGEYKLYEVRLQGGYICHAWIDPNTPSVTVTPQTPAVLKIGAPLKQSVEVERQGRVLTLNYKLLGAGGENYSFERRDKPPIFTVYKADKEIASGNFEFG
ncbi:MAG: hypothetical protein A2173_05745 [Planctomycetes bacterium RBG_13_44_8b]|nr:MAG: hypothetical protein A2173_05745 [Planctomycetes bacterium RBG_13_44_8b]